MNNGHSRLGNYGSIGIELGKEEGADAMHVRTLQSGAEMRAAGCIMHGACESNLEIVSAPSTRVARVII